MPQPTATIVWIGRANRHCGQCSVIIAINGIRWEYYLTHQNAETAEFYARQFSMGKALAFAKSRATAAVKLELPRV